MAREFPFFIEGQIVDISIPYRIAYVRVPNGNIYHLYPNTPGIDFQSLKKTQIARLEITSILTRVLSATILDK
jgi:hypothetical protein